jgi:hypothetical protein
MVKKTRLIIGITAIVIGIVSFVLLYSALSQADTQKYQSTVIATLVLTMEAR